MRKIDADALDQELGKVYADNLDGIVRFGIKKCIDVVRHAPTINDGWIPVKTRDMTAEEIEELRESCDLFDSDYSDFWCYDCPLPDDQQDVLITTKWGVSLVTCTHDDDGCYFDDYDDRDDVLAWMPLPKPYTKEEQS